MPDTINTVQSKDADFSYFQKKLEESTKKSSFQDSLIFKLDKPEKKGSENSAVVRILPYKYADRNFPFIETFFHYSIGTAGTVACPKNNFQEKCAICDHVDGLYKKSQKIGRKHSIDTNNRDKMRSIPEINALWDTANNLRVKKRVYVPITVVSVNGKEPTEEQGGIKFLGMSPSLFDTKVVPALSKQRKINPLDRYNGFAFQFSMKNDGSSFGKTDFSVITDDDASPILSNTTPDEIDAFVDTVPEIWSTLLKRKSSQEVQDILSDVLVDDETELESTSNGASVDIASEMSADLDDEFSAEISESLEEVVNDLDSLLS